MKTINNKNKKTGIIVIVFVLFILLVTGLTSSCKKSTCNYTPCTVRDSINVSTGLDTFGINNAPGGIDNNWKVVSSPYPAGTPALTSTSGGPWQATPIAGTNADWINCTGLRCCTNLIGVYTFERKFTIPPGTISFSCDFGIAVDDSLVSIDLIPPTLLPITSLTAVPSGYALTPDISTIIASPAAGVWTIRTKVEFIDSYGGFLTSGYIKILRPC